MVGNEVEEFVWDKIMKWGSMITKNLKYGNSKTILKPHSQQNFKIGLGNERRIMQSLGKNATANNLWQTLKIVLD